MNYSPFDPARASKVSQVLGFFRTEETRALISAAFARPGLGDLALIEGGIDVAVKVIRRGDQPNMIVFDVFASVNRHDGGASRTTDHRCADRAPWMTAHQAYRPMNQIR